MVYYKRCSQIDEFPSLLSSTRFPTKVSPTQILFGPIPNPTAPRPSSLTSTLPFAASWTSYPVPNSVASPAYPMFFSTYIDHVSEEARGYLFTLTNEYSGAFTIDAV